jgi:hypothetical protein
MPKLGLALSAAGAGPVRIPAGNLIPQRILSGGSGGSGSGSGEGIGDFLVNDSSLVLWLMAEQETSGLFAPSGVWWGSAGSAFRVSSETVPYYEPATVTVSGGLAFEYEAQLEVNGVYQKVGVANGNAVYEKAEPTVGIIRINNLYGNWTIRKGSGEVGNILYGGVGQNPWNVQSWTKINAASGPSPYVTLTSPDCLRFEGSEYLQFTNPLTGNSAELFAVIKPNALGIGETSGPVIGNIGGPNLETFLGADGIVGFAPQLFRGAINAPMHTYGTTPVHSSWHLFSISSQSLAEGGYYRVRRNSAMPLNYFSVWSRNTFNNEGPFIGRSTQGAGAYFKGRIAEIMLYNRSLAPSERLVVQTYLNTKYSLWT